MGRPIKKDWFTARFGPVQGNLTVLTSTGPKAILSQPGTSTYEVAIGEHVTLVDDTLPLAAGQCQLQHNNKYVRTLAQFQLSYFDGTTALWNDGRGNITGTFNPALTSQDSDIGAPPVTPPPAVVPATLGAIVVDENQGPANPGTIASIAVATGGANYVTAPTVTITGANTTPATATATISGGVVTNIVITNPGAGYDDSAVSASLS
jgi:hypothetical protein